ncbi:TIR domain-containing protein [Leucobacter sp. 1207-22]|uniref:TIR domain-containing protein n=1 Tax=Leucobacter sp. 1207-22 TaxID=2604456 RepID=UPI004063FA50
MAQISGFWSYVHADDDAESGRITKLASDVRSKFEMLTGESINLFVDREKLKWGDDWRNEIDDSLASVAFFVPVITPRYFRSEECRRELNFFARRAERLGIKDLVLPIIWTRVAQLDEDESNDELMELAKKFQWSVWLDLKYEDVGTGEYRRAVDDLAQRLVEANEIAEEALKDPVSMDTEDDEDESPGDLETFASMESALPEMMQIMEQVGQAIQEIGESMQAATNDVNANSNPNAALATRLRVTRDLANTLRNPSEEIRDLGNGFASSLNEVDQGVRLMIAKAPQEIAEDSSTFDHFNSFFASIKALLPEAEQGLGAVAQMIAQIEPLEKMSRELRKPLRTLRDGLTFFVDGLDVMRGWVALIDENPIESPQS